MKKILLMAIFCFISTTALFSQNKPAFLNELYIGADSYLNTGIQYKGFFLHGQIAEENKEKLNFGAGLAYDFTINKTGTSFRLVASHNFTYNTNYAWAFASQQIGKFPIQPALFADTDGEVNIGFVAPIPINKWLEMYIWARQSLVCKTTTVDLQINFKFWGD